jgi:hypothetical protein
MDYYTALKRSGKILEAYFEQSKDVFHNASKGAIREQIVNRVIRPFMPQCYGLSGGEVFDKYGNTSKQLDLIVYDNLFSYTVPYIDNFIQFPCESIYGNIEIKSNLNKDEFDKAIENIRSFKCLRREGTHSWTVTPQVQITINGQPNDHNRNPYFGIIFAYESVEAATIKGYFEEKRSVYTPDLLPNAIVLYSKKQILMQTNARQVEAYPCNNFDRYTILDCGEDTLALFIGLLINFTRFTLLKAADIHLQTNQLFERVLSRSIKNEDIVLV